MRCRWMSRESVQKKSRIPTSMQLTQIYDIRFESPDSSA